MLEPAFANFKEELCDGVAEGLSNPDKAFLVETGASIHAVEAVLLQIDGEKEYSTLLYSQGLNACQLNYSI